MNAGPKRPWGGLAVILLGIVVGMSYLTTGLTGEGHRADEAQTLLEEAGS